MKKINKTQQKQLSYYINTLIGQEMEEAKHNIIKFFDNNSIDWEGWNKYYYGIGFNLKNVTLEIWLSNNILESFYIKEV